MMPTMLCPWWHNVLKPCVFEWHSPYLNSTKIKTEFLVISSPYFHESVCDTSLKVGDAVISSSAQCRNLGVIFDSKLDMKKHVAMVCRSALFQLRKIGTIRKYLSDDSCANVSAFVWNIEKSITVILCWLICRTVFSVNFRKCRMLQHTSSLDVVMFMIYLQCLSTSIGFLFRYEFVTKSIFWLSNVSMNSDLLTWKIFSLPISLNENLRSATKELLEENGYKLETYRRRAYFVVGPSFWNDLPCWS